MLEKSLVAFKIINILFFLYKVSFLKMSDLCILAPKFYISNHHKQQILTSQYIKSKHTNQIRSLGTFGNLNLVEVSIWCSWCTQAPCIPTFT